MTNQPDLFNMDDIPKGPSRATRLQAFKSKHFILTHDAGKSLDGDGCRWLACVTPSRRLDNDQPLNGMTLVEMMRDFCRLLDEGGYTGYGNDEREAVIECARARGIECDL